MRLDLRLLEVFCSVYEESSFSKAAEKLFLSQPTVSGHIKTFEGHLGTKLFDRLPREVVPTAAARLLYRHGRSILKEREAALQNLKQFLNRIEGSLRISASTIPGEYLLPSIISSFHIRFPAVKLELKISDSQTVCQEVLGAQAELGFVGAKLEAAGLTFRHFARDKLALVVPNNREWRDVESITPDSLASKPFLARERGSGTRLAFEKKMGRSLDELNVVACFGSTNAVKEALRAGLGISVLSILAVKSEIERGELKTVTIEGFHTIPRDFFAVVNKNLTLSPIADTFLDEHVLNTSVKVVLTA